MIEPPIEEIHFQKLKAKLRQAKSELENQKKALDQSSIVAITNDRGVITYVNDSFCEISGYLRSELIGSTHKVVNSGYHDSSFFKDLWSTIKKGEIWRGQIKNRSKSGRFYWVETTIVPFVKSNGQPYQYIAIRNDITKNVQQQLNLEEERARRMYSEKMASLGVLSSGIAHELGNPLAALRGRLEMLEEQLASQTFDEEKLLLAVQKSIKTTDRMAHIIRSLRSYARDGSQDPYLLVSINCIIEDVLEMLGYYYNKNQVKLEFEGLDNEIFIEGRETELSQAFLNLLKNACDAIKDQTQKWVKIHIHEDKLKKRVIVQIVDSGHGIPKEIQNKIFDPFFTTKKVGEGTGLGLSITRSIILAHKGQLFIDDTMANTCFQMELPIKQG